MFESSADSVGQVESRRPFWLTPSARRRAITAASVRASLRSELRVFYVAGAGDSPGVLRDLASGRPFADMPHITYSGQLLNACLRLGARALTVSWGPGRATFEHGPLSARMLDDPFAGRSGVGYHAASRAFARSLVNIARAFGANVAVLPGLPSLFWFEALVASGVTVIPTYHNTPTLAFHPDKATARALTRLECRFAARRCPAILTHPGLAATQLRRLTGDRVGPLVEFLPLYHENLLSRVPKAELSAPARFLYLGRMEQSKGIFLLLAVAKRLRAMGRSDIGFDVCGDGSALGAFREAVQRDGLASSIAVHGVVDNQRAIELWTHARAAVVPTTARFNEGFNQVVVEAILAGRPVITSKVCPALDYVRAAAIEAAVDDVDSYLHAIVTLADDHRLHARLCAAAPAAAAPFYRYENSYGFAVEHVLRALRQGEPIQPLARPPQGVGSR